jgi:hypothetical protein
MSDSESRGSANSQLEFSESRGSANSQLEFSESRGSANSQREFSESRGSANSQREFSEIQDIARRWAQPWNNLSIHVFMIASLLVIVLTVVLWWMQPSILAPKYTEDDPEGWFMHTYVPLLYAFITSAIIGMLFIASMLIL